jgi:hypothetical protein
MSYPHRLASLAPERSLIHQADSRVVILTGQSSFTSSRLSAIQQGFLEAITPPGFDLMPAGFPYHADLLGTRPEPSILSASWRNAAQTFWSAAPTVFRQALAQTLNTLLSRTNRRLILITGSCGLQLANSVWPELNKPAELDIRVIALGPACFGTLQVPATVIQGRRDYWSKLFYRGPVKFHVPCGHLDYWTSHEVRALICKSTCEFLS